MIVGEYYLTLSQSVCTTRNKVDYRANISHDTLATLNKDKTYKLILDGDVLRLVEDERGKKLDINNRHGAHVRGIEIIKPLLAANNDMTFRIYGEILDESTCEVVFPLRNKARLVKRK